MQAANLCDRFPLNRWVGDALRFLRKPSEEYPVWKDYWETNREAEFLRNHPVGSPGYESYVGRVRRGVDFWEVGQGRRFGEGY